MLQCYNINVGCVVDAHDYSVGSGNDGDQGKHVFVNLWDARLGLTSVYGADVNKFDLKNYSSFRPISLWQCSAEVFGGEEIDVSTYST